MLTIPSEFVTFAALAIGLVSVFVCVSTFIWRYAEHNAAHGENRKGNKMKFSFIGALLLAVIATGLLSYALSAGLVNLLGVVEPCAVDYIVAGGFLAILLGLGFTILFEEGVSGYAKFLTQKVKEIKAGADDLAKALAEAGVDADAVKALLASAKKKDDDEVEIPKE